MQWGGGGEDQVGKAGFFWKRGEAVVKPRPLDSDWQPVTYLRDKALPGGGGSNPVIPIAVTIVIVT